ncbi:ABC transporter substrate-binding protein [Cohnella sp. 56]|uniref:ABC transporter substrate-binding protein n=1 Tax=Cohnella sp. 56 TaxID=3113722 RepID=UPI0030EA444F
MSSRLAQFATILLIVFLLAACGDSGDKGGASSQTASAAATAQPSASPAASEADGRLLTDADGHEVRVPDHPQRIVAPFLEDPLSALGMKPVAQWGAGGVPQQYLQDKLSDVPVLRMDDGLKPEEVLSYNPDLIIFLTSAYAPSGSYEQFAKIAPTFVLSTSDADWRGNLEKLGALLNEQDAAAAALARYDEKLADAKAKLGSLPSEKTAVLLQAADKGFKLFGSDFYGGVTLYQALGFGQPAVLKGSYESYSAEQLAELADVDYIFVLSGPGRQAPPTDNPLWQQLKAVKEGHVFEADSGYWFNLNSIAGGLIIDDVLKNVHE